MSFKITTLIENNISKSEQELYTEHGLSMYIEADGKNILFDTGQTGNFLKNSRKLNIDINKLDSVILSHGHYDHTGGLETLVDNIKHPIKLTVGDGFFDEKYKLTDDGKALKYIGNSFNKSFIHSRGIHIEYISTDVFYLSENIMIFTNFNRNSGFETLNEKFFVKRNNILELDDFKDEIVLALKVEKGLFIILGCSHVGVVNILETIAQRTGMNIYGILGGTHLVDADKNKLKKTIEYFQQKNIQQIGVAHCTGEQACEVLKSTFNIKFFNNNTGNTIELI